MQNSVAKKIFAVGSAVAMTLSLAVPFVASAAPHAAGTNVSSSDGTVWLITDTGTRRAYTSAGAFLAYGFNSWSQVVAANADDIALPIDAASYIAPQNGTVFCATETKGSDVKDECSLVTGGMKAAFTSAAVFSALGFSFARAQYGDSSFLSKTSNIDSSTAAHKPGVLVNNNGTVQLVGANGLLGIPDEATFNSWGYSFENVVPANDADKAMSQTGIMAARVGAQLDPTVLTVTSPVTTTGLLTISTASGLAAASTVPKSSTNVPFLKFVISNSGGSAITVDQVTVHRGGSGATTDFSSVYIYQGSMRLTTGRTVNSSSNDAVFSALNLSVPANGSVTLDVLGSIASTASAGNVHALSVTSVLSGSVAATGSAMGNNMTIAGVTGGTITVTKNGSIANPKVGQMATKVAAFQLAASSSEDLVVKRIALYHAGSTARANLSNLKLTQGGNTIGTTAALDSRDHANFDMNFSLAKGDTKVFELWADIAAAARAGSSETVKFYVEETADVFALGSTYGFGASVDTGTVGTYDGTSCTSSSGNCSYSAIEGGQLTMTFNGPSAKDISKNGKAVEVFNFTVAAQNNLEVRGLKLTFNNGGSGTADFNDGTTANYTNIKVAEATSGKVVWGPQDLSGTGSATSQDITFTEYENLTAGTSKTYKVILDVANNSDVTDSDKLGVTLVTSFLTSSKVKNTDNNTFLSSTDIVPTSSLAGNQMTVKTASVTAALASTPTSKSFVKGTNAVNGAGIVFTASTAKDIKVTDLTLTGMIATSTSTTLADGVQSSVNVSDDVITVSLWDGTTQVGQTKSPAVTTGLVVFNNMNWVITAGQSKTLVVQMNLSSSANASDKIKWKVATGGITAVDLDGNSITDSTSYPVNGSTSTTAGTTITITGAGTISVATAGNNEQDITDARVVTAGSMGVTLGKISFTASNEDLKLTKARINIVSASSTGTGSNIGDEVTALYLYDGATKVAGPVSLTPSGSTEGYADFTSLAPDFVVTSNDTKTLTVKADLNTISNGGDSGAQFNIALDGSNNFEVRGVVGNTLLTAPSSGTYAGSLYVVRKGQPKVEVIALASGTKLASGTNTLLRLKITAVDSAVAIKHITFTSSTSTGVTLSSPAIARLGGSNLTITSATTYGSGSATFDVTFNSEELIDVGNPVTYDFKADASLAGQTNYSVSTKIAASDSAIVTGFLTSLAAAQAVTDDDAALGVGNANSAASAAYNFIWSDKSAVPHNDTQGSGGSHDWTNGLNVKIIPTDSQGLSF